MAGKEIPAMPDQKAKPLRPGVTLIWYLAEMAVYAIFVFVYYLLVLRFLGGWLKDVFTEHLTLYAILVLVLILAQAVLLELVTAGLFKLIRGNSR